MNRYCNFLGIILLGGHFAVVNAQDAPPAFSDSFERQEVGKSWASHIGSWEIREGVLVGKERAGDGHGAVTQTYLDFDDLVLEFRFQLVGSPGFNVVIDDRKFKGSHAGHICRAAVSKKSIRLADDKTGGMENGLFARLRDPQQKAAAQKELVGKQKSLPVDLKENQWYRLRVSITGETLRCELDGKPIGELTSPGIGHATKSDFGFTVRGDAVEFDDIKAWLPADR